MSVQIMSENTASDGHGQDEDILVLKCKHWYTDCVWVAAAAGGHSPNMKNDDEHLHF